MRFVKILACMLMLSVVLLSFAGCGGDDGQYSDITVGGGEMVQNGDIVIIDFLGMIDGVPFPGGAADGWELEIGSGSFIPGFEEAIIGMRIGGVRDINIPFPENYHVPDLAGQTAVFRITLHDIKVLAEHSGTFILELYPEYAPLTVENFVGLVEQGFYNGVTFHRIVDGFMAQGGCPQGTGRGGSGTNIVCETIANGWEQNTLNHTPGVISMAHAGTNTGSSQFFLMLGNAPHLDGRHAGFGRIIEGMEVVEQLQTVPRNFNQMGELASPIQPVTIISMTVIEDSENGNPRVQAEISWFS